MYKNDGVTRRYSESFKLKILAELSTGKYSKRQLSRIYGIQSSTINKWVRKYDRKDLMNTRIMVQTKDEISRLKELQKEIEQLKKKLDQKGFRQARTRFLFGSGCRKLRLQKC